MGAIKNFYFDEICAMQEGEVFDEEYFENKLKKHEEDRDNAVIQKFEEIQEHIIKSDIPAWLLQ